MQITMKCSLTDLFSSLLANYTTLKKFLTLLNIQSKSVIFNLSFFLGSFINHYLLHGAEAKKSNAPI